MKILPMRQVPQSCHWSVPTLFMPPPYWLSAWDSPWCCWNAGDIWILATTETCLSCPLWKPREVDYGQPEAIPPRGSVPLPSA